MWVKISKASVLNCIKRTAPKAQKTISTNIQYCGHVKHSGKTCLQRQKPEHIHVSSWIAI